MKKSLGVIKIFMREGEIFGSSQINNKQKNIETLSQESKLIIAYIQKELELIKNIKNKITQISSKDNSEDEIKFTTDYLSKDWLIYKNKRSMYE